MTHTHWYVQTTCWHMTCDLTRRWRCARRRRRCCCLRRLPRTASCVGVNYPFLSQCLAGGAERCGQTAIAVHVSAGLPAGQPFILFAFVRQVALRAADTPLSPSKVSPADFQVMKVVGQGAFGKVSWSQCTICILNLVAGGLLGKKAMGVAGKVNLGGAAGARDLRVGVAAPSKERGLSPHRVLH